MLTPQDLQEVYFDKARFGGYNMQSVDDFLEPLIADYQTLYKENAVLKSKMRLLVERLEAYRGKEAEIKQAIADTQQNCDDMIAKAERRAAELLKGAESSAQLRSRDIEGATRAEEQRLERAKADTQRFIGKVEAVIAQQCALLEELKALDLTPAPDPEPAPAANKPYDFDAEADDPILPIATEPVPVLAETQDDIASEIEQNVERIMESVPTPPEELSRTKVMPAVDFGREDKFSDLQFGKNYDPTK